MRFELGFIVATPACMDAVPPDAISAAINQHARGRWGEVDAEDQETNDRALEHGGRVMSAWTAHGVQFWIITEADRSATTALLPSDY